MRFILIVSLALAGLMALSPVRAETRVGLVIAVQDYQNIPKLDRPKQDADAVAETLGKLGFSSIDRIIDADRRKIFAGLSEFRSKIKDADTVFVQFSGHGVSIDGENYLLPRDAPDQNVDKSLFISQAISQTELLRQLDLDDQKPRRIIIVIDACRDNPYEKDGLRGIGQRAGLNTSSVDGAFIMYSAGRNQRALDNLSATDPEPTSVYTRVLIKNLMRPGSNLIDIANDTKAEVRRLALSVNHAQNPAYYDEMDGRSVVLSPASDTKPQFDPEPKPAPEPTPDPVPTPAPQPEPAPELRDIEVVYFQRDADEGRVLGALQGLHMVPSIRTSTETKPSNVIVCGPDVSLDAIITLGSALINSGVEIYAIETSDYPNFRTRMTIESWEVGDDDEPLTEADLKRLEGCQRYVKKRARKLTLINDCPRSPRIHFQLKYVIDDRTFSTKENNVKYGDRRAVTDADGNKKVAAQKFYVYGESDDGLIVWPGQKRSDDGPNYRSFYVDGERRIFSRVTSFTYRLTCTRS